MLGIRKILAANPMFSGVTVIDATSIPNPLPASEYESIENVFDVFPCLIPPFARQVIITSEEGFFIVERADLSDPGAARRMGIIPPIYHPNDETHWWKSNEDIVQCLSDVLGIEHDHARIFSREKQKWVILCAFIPLQGETEGFGLSCSETGVAEVSSFVYRTPKNPYLRIGALLQALALLHCKNIEIVDENPAGLPRKERKERSKTGIAYKTLIINPLNVRKQRLTAPAIPRKHLAPLSVCRGHFKDYSGKGLFGKYKGLYWWESFARGEAKNGQIINDYRLEKG